MKTNQIDYYQQITKNSKAILKFWHLEKADRNTFKPLLSRMTLNAIAVLEVISVRESTYEEIMKKTHFSYEVIVQTIGALRKGGLNIVEDRVTIRLPRGGGIAKTFRFYD